MDDRMTPTERSARITFLLCAVGLAMTTREIARLSHMSQSGALKMLDRISRVVPIYLDDGDIWRRCP